jgi:hypothetical protein
MVIDGACDLGYLLISFFLFFLFFGGGFYVALRSQTKSAPEGPLSSGVIATHQGGNAFTHATLLVRCRSVRLWFCHVIQRDQILTKTPPIKQPI